MIPVAYRIGIKNRAGKRMALFTEIRDPETHERRLALSYQHPSVDPENLARMRRLAERTWKKQGRDRGASGRPRNEWPRS